MIPAADWMRRHQTGLERSHADPARCDPQCEGDGKIAHTDRDPVPETPHEPVQMTAARCGGFLSGIIHYIIF